MNFQQICAHKLWVGLQISEENICVLGKNRWVLKMLRKKDVIFGKNLWVGAKYRQEQIFGIPSTNICLNPPASAGGVLTNNNRVRRLEINEIIPSPRN